MAARDVLGANLTALMLATPALGSQGLLNKKSGVPTSTIGRIRRAEVAATVDNVEELARAFKLSAADLLDPLLPKRLKLTVPSSGEDPARAYELAEQVRLGPWTAQQLTLIETTLAALRGPAP